jgi:hypothetical protein
MPATRRGLASRSSAVSFATDTVSALSPQLPPLSPVTVTQLLRAKLRGDDMAPILQGGILRVQEAALQAFSSEGGRVRGLFTGEALSPVPVAQQDFLAHNTAVARWSGSECLPHGHGKFVYPSGDAFTGRWEAGHRTDGYGVMRCGDGSVYKGRWNMGKRHGQGKMKYANGDAFDGQWTEDRRKNGPGVMTYSNGDRYDGEFLADKRHGRGIIVYGSTPSGPGRHRRGDRFEGQFEHDHRLNGFGRMHYANGSVYQGDWRDELRYCIYLVRQQPL